MHLLSEHLLGMRRDQGICPALDRTGGVHLVNDMAPWPARVEA